MIIDTRFSHWFSGDRETIDGKMWYLRKTSSFFLSFFFLGKEHIKIYNCIGTEQLDCYVMQLSRHTSVNLHVSNYFLATLCRISCMCLLSGTIFCRKMCLAWNVCFVFPWRFIWNFSQPKKISERYLKLTQVFVWRVSYCCPILAKLECSWQIVVKISNIKLMKIHPAGTEFQRKYGRMEGREEANSWYSQLCDLACKCRNFVQHVWNTFQFCSFTRWEYVFVSKYYCKIMVLFCPPPAHRFLCYGSCFCTKLNGINIKFPITLFTLLVAEDGIALCGNFHRDVYFLLSFAASDAWN